jgi:lipopolysaccharide heptosyltransferase II
VSPPAGSASSWSGARNVLAIRLDAVGDVLMTTPAIRALKERAPGRRVTLLTSSAGAAVAPLIPEVDDVLVYDAPWMKATPPRSAPDTDLGAISTLRDRRFDAAAIFTVYSQDPLPAAFLCSLAGIPLRLAHTRQKAYGLLTDAVPDPEPERIVRHEVRRQLDLVATVGCRTRDERLSVRVGRAAASRVAGLLDDLGVDAAARPWAVLHPGASAPSRRYPPEGFAEVARRLLRDHGWDVVVAGGRGDGDAADRILAAAPGVRPVIGALDLEELAALLSAAPLLIANNSAPAHLAAAVGTPVVDLYALTNPQHAPWGVPHRVLFHDVPCRNCGASVCPEGHHACLRLVPPERVVAAALELTTGPIVADDLLRSGPWSIARSRSA